MAKRPSPITSLPTAIMAIIRLAFIVGAALAAAQGSWEVVTVSVIGLILSLTPQLIERKYRIDLPVTYELVIVLFVFAGIFMGELAHAYDKFWWWDVVLHTSSGVLVGYVGFLVLAILHKTGKIRMSAGMVAFFTFSVGMASAGIWEVVEFSIDQLFGTTMQKGPTDTMGDIIVAGLGSLVAAVAAYVHIKWPGRSILRPLVRDFTDANPHLDRKKATRAKS